MALLISYLNREPNIGNSQKDGSEHSSQVGILEPWVNKEEESCE